MTMKEQISSKLKSMVTKHTKVFDRKRNFAGKTGQMHSDFGRFGNDYN